MLKLGESGPAVTALQQRLSDLGYWMGTPDGTYGQLTRQAVMAFQKAEGLGRDGTAGPITQRRLATAGRPAARDGSYNHIEIDLERQIMMVVANGQVQWAFNTSTGSGEAYTSSSGGLGPGGHPAGHASPSSARSTASARPRWARSTGPSTSTAASPCTARAASPPAGVARVRPAHQRRHGPPVVRAAWPTSAPPSSSTDPARP